MNGRDTALSSSQPITQESRAEREDRIAAAVAALLVAAWRRNHAERAQPIAPKDSAA